MKRLTTDNPKGNFDKLMNFAFAKNYKAILSYADGEENVELHSYISKLAKQKGINLSPEEIMEDGLMDFPDEDFSVLYYCAVQAAELRARLKLYEDKLENGTLIDILCKVEDKVYSYCKLFNCVLAYEVEDIHIDKEQTSYFATAFDYSPSYFGEYLDEINFTDEQFNKTVFFTKEEAEKALEGLKNE